MYDPGDALNDASRPIDSPSVSALLAEMDALSAALRAAELGEDPDDAKARVAGMTEHRNPKTIEEFVVAGAMRRILGKLPEAPGLRPVKQPWDKQLEEIVGLAWLFWARGDNDRATAILRKLSERQKKHERVAARSGAVNVVTLTFWSKAVTHLLEGDRKLAQKFFKRAIEIGSQIGTDSHPMISWAYAATYFP